jgi:hypothetical protein
MSREIATRHRDDMWHMLGVEPGKEWPTERPGRNFWAADLGDPPSNMAELCAAGLARDRGPWLGSRMFELTDLGKEWARRLYDEEVKRRGIKTFYYEWGGFRGTCRGETRSKARYAHWLSARDCYPDLPITAIKIGPQVRTAPCPPPTA